MISGEKSSSTPEAARLGERRDLKTISKAALSIVTAGFAFFAPRSTALAHLNHYACCHLVYQPSSQCLADCSDFGGTIRSWVCQDAGIHWRCYECQLGGTNCWDGAAYYCSWYKLA